MDLDLYPRTKERLAQIMDEFAAIKNGDLAKFFQAKKLPVPFDPNAWDRYIESISGHPPCLICGDVQTPQVLRKGLICRLYPIHARVVEHAGLLMAQSLITFETAAFTVLGPVCEHSRYLVECEICIQKANQKNIEKNHPLKGDNK